MDLVAVERLVVVELAGIDLAVVIGVVPEARIREGDVVDAEPMTPMPTRPLRCRTW
jgi:hypothetical protein